MIFWKMHGAGNDFVITDNRDLKLRDGNKFAKDVCDRHFGVGADGFIAAENSHCADVKMNFYNADGTPATMCGNGIRCFAKYVRDTCIVEKSQFTVETGDGVKHVKMISEKEKKSIALINMGSWSFLPANIAIHTNKLQFVNEEIQLSDSTTMKISCVHLGVHHGIIFVKEDIDYVGKYGEEIENYALFKEGMNVNFVKVIDEKNIAVSTWERGAGRTLACGTGACSSVVIANKLGITEKNVRVTVPGGMLEISMLEDDSVDMQGPAELVCKGDYWND